MSRSIKVFLSVMCGLCLCLSGCEYFGRTEIGVMTFNILYNSHKVSSGVTCWESRRPVLIDCLQRHAPDIMGIQEGFDFQCREIKQVFVHWRFFGRGRYDGVLAVDPRRPFEDLGGETCNIFYNDTRFRLLEEGTFWHSDHPDSVASRSWGNSLPRIVTWGKFQVIHSGRRFVVMNTHFHWDQPYVDNTAKLIMRKWREIAAGLPTILMGDFNLPPTSATHELFCGRGGPEELRGTFIDCWQVLKKPETDAGTSHSFTGKGENRIDWILITPEFEVQSIEIIYDHAEDCYPSDHFPVMARLSL